MAQVTGEIVVKHGGNDYRLCLGLRGIATLQQEYGKDLDVLDLPEGGVPDFGVLLRVVELSLQRHHPDADGQVAEDILAADFAVYGMLITAAFPRDDAAVAPAQGPAAGKKKAAR